MHATSLRHGGFAVLQQVLFHALVSVTAIAIAFTLPTFAGFVLYEWWPRVSASSRLLLVTELALAAALLVAFHAARVVWDSLRVRRMHAMAALVQVRRDSPRTRARVSARDALILSVTGFHTFASPEAPFHDLVAQGIETRVMLLNPFSEGARERIRSLPDAAAAEALYRKEIGASLAWLRSLAESGRRVRLKLYDRAPFWSIVVAGDRAWVRHCHDGYPLSTQPDYVFARREDEPTQGLFPPFCLYTLNQWNDPANAEYDFATGELVYPGVEGASERRIPFLEMEKGKGDATL